MISKALKYKFISFSLLAFASLTASCMLDEPSGPDDELAELGDVDYVEQDLSTNATCTGPSTMTGYYSGGRRYTNPVTVSCSGTVSRIRVWGELRIFGALKDSKDVTCWNSSSCTMPSMSAVAGQNDSWTSQYWFNWTN